MYKQNLDQLPDGVVENILYYYQGVAQLKQMVADHANQSKVDAKTLENGKENMKKFAGSRFGGVINQGKDGPPMVALVELGQPLCGGKP